jgi:hypothetical protein
LIVSDEVQDFPKQQESYSIETTIKFSAGIIHKVFLKSQFHIFQAGFKSTKER